MRHDVHARRIEPHEERLVGGFGSVDKLESVIEYLVVDGFHAIGVKRAGVLNSLLADLSPSRIDRRIVRIGGPTMQHIARADLIFELLRIVGVRRILHCVQMIQIAEEFVEAVKGRQILI